MNSVTADFRKRGYAVVRGFLQGGELQRLAENVDRYVRTVAPGVAAEDAFYHDPSRPETLRQLHRMERDPFFAACLTDARWVGMAEQLLGEEARATGAEWFNKPPGASHATPAHQDNYYFCLEPPNVLTMWLALDEVGEDNGCLRYLPGSHEQGIRPHGVTGTLGFSQGIVDYGDADRVREEPILASPGDLLVHHGNTIHRADANRSQRSRRSFGMVFRGVSCQRDEAAFQRYQASVRRQQEAAGP